MLIRKNEVRFVENEHMRGGKNSVFGGVLLDLATLKGAGRLFNKMVIPPMCEVGYHTHSGDSELYYVIEGSGIYNDNGVETTISKGDMTFTPDGFGHGFYNNTEENVVLLASILYNFTPEKDLSELRRIEKAGTHEIGELHAPFGGKGDFFAEKLMKGDDFTGAARLFNILHLLPGCELGYHQHNGETEVFYMLKGNAVFTDDDQKFEVGPGDVLITPSGHYHAMENQTDEEVIYAAIIYFDKV